MMTVEVLNEETDIPELREFLGMVVQDSVGNTFEARVPLSKFEYCFDYEMPLNALEHFKAGKFLRIRGAKLCQTKNQIESEKLWPVESNLLEGKKKVYHLDLETSWGVNCNFMVIPDQFKLSQLLNERVIEDELIKQLLDDQMETKILSTPKVISKVSKFYENFEFTPITDLVEKSNQENFKIKFILMSVLP